MNRLKYEQMSKGDYMSVEPRFSMFNRQTQHPFDPVPNVAKIAPETEELA